jgi:hypothetical protein
MIRRNTIHGHSPAERENEKPATGRTFQLAIQNAHRCQLLQRKKVGARENDHRYLLHYLGTANFAHTQTHARTNTKKKDSTLPIQRVQNVS